MSSPLTAAEFLQELAQLRARFQAMQAELEVTVRDPAQGVEGYVVVWNTAISQGGPLSGCGKGGTRITKDLQLDDVKRLARAMAEKNAAAGLPLGGAKSGMRLDPNAADYEQKFRRFVTLCAPLLHEKGGVFGGFGYDVGCKPPLNAEWACDELGTTRCFTGKPVAMGGTDYDREGIAGLGVAVAARTLLEAHGVAMQGATFAVQGAGAMGGAVIRYATEFGGILRCVSDPKYDGTWLLPTAPTAVLVAALAHQHHAEAMALLTAEGQKISADCAVALYADVDIMFPCALEDVLRDDNAGQVRARYVVEGANNPTTEAAHRLLFVNGVHLVPDIIANAGGIIAAYVELTSPVTAAENVQTYAKVTEAKEMTIRKVTENTRRLTTLVKQHGVAPDQVGDYIAYSNIFYGLTTSAG